MEVKCPSQSLNFPMESMLQLPTNEVQPISKKRSELRQNVNSVARNLKLQPMCSGLVHFRKERVGFGQRMSSEMQQRGR